MTRRLLAVLLCVLLAGGTSALAQQPIPPSQRYASVLAATDVAQYTLPAVDVAALRAEDRARADRVGPYRYGRALDTRYTSARDGTWERLPSGNWLWRLRLTSKDAVSMSVGISPFELPEGAALYVHGPGDTRTHGPYTAADATAGQHWTPLVQGDRILLELEVPAGQRSAVTLAVGHVVHGYRSLPSPSADAAPKSGRCNLDVACEEADPWRKQVRSVARYTFEKNGSTFFCSGALVNNTAEDKTPYFLTAEHCVSTPAQAASMVFYWNYQNRTCRPLGSPGNGDQTTDDPTDQTASGAVLRARSGNWHANKQISGGPDLTLVEIDDTLPPHYNLYFSGWSRAYAATATGVSIHHPSGDGKRISFDRDSTHVTGFGTPGDTTHLRVGDWETGTTEKGSSGGPLFNDDRHIVGVLSGGRAGCGGGGGTNDNDLPDWYGRLAPGFGEGDYDGATLADVLDPLGTGARTLDGRPQVATTDRTPPAAVQGLRVDRVEPPSREVVLRWEASGDDGRQGTADRYDLRYDTTRIETASDFARATRVQGTPPPASPGTPERVVLDASDGLARGRRYFFALVAEDEAGNRSDRAAPRRAAVLPPAIEIEKGGLTVGSSASAPETQFVLTETQAVRIALYDVLGRQVRVIRNDIIEAGFEQRVRVRTTGLSSGLYFLRFKGETFTTTRTLAVVH